MNKVITESGMSFIADNSFHIEESNLYKGLGKGVRSVEFLRIKDNKLLFIEAKRSFPNPNNPDIENMERFQLEIDEVCEKFIHSLNLLFSIEVGVLDSVFESDFILPEKIVLEFVLVIKNHEMKWCKLVQDKLTTNLPKYIIKIWKPIVYVINYENAARWKLIVD